MTHVYEYDARVVTDHVTISSRVDGVLRELKVDTGDMVSAGAVLGQMDDRVPSLELRALQSELAALQTERSQYSARSTMVTQQTDSRYKTRLTSIRAERARRSALAAELRLARQELKRFRSLFEKRVIARSRLDRAESEVARLASDVRRADAGIAASRGEAQEAQADKAELSVIEQEAALIDFKEAMLRARIARHEALLSYRTIQAPKAGVVDRVFVEEGEFLGEGRRVLMLHDPEDTWVEANIKETQVRRLRVGQRVAIDVDAYPDDKFVGRVAKIGAAATSSFALLPTPNPSGNFTKVTQRIPVKIMFEQRPRPLAPGMMVEVEIDTRDGG
jgi:membrane fusion protein (multidrug efflux system)